MSKKLSARISKVEELLLQRGIVKGCGCATEDAMQAGRMLVSKLFSAKLGTSDTDIEAEKQAASDLIKSWDDRRRDEVERCTNHNPRPVRFDPKASFAPILRKLFPDGPSQDDDQSVDVTKELRPSRFAMADLV